MDRAKTTPTRRALLSGVAVGVAALLAGCAGTGAASDAGDDDASSDVPKFDGWLSNVEHYDGVADLTGRSTVTVAVGGDDGLSFDPPAVRVDAGATVRWEWVGGGSAHNVVGRDGAFESDTTSKAGTTFERTFDDAGVVKYLCVPHEYAGMKGVVVAK